MSQTIDNADVAEPPFSEVEGTVRPFSLAGPAPKEYWDVKLEDAIRIALENGKVLRSIGGQVQGPPTLLTSNPTGAPMIYDPAIAETDVRFGVNAGLSLFDPQLNTDLFWSATIAAKREPVGRYHPSHRVEPKHSPSRCHGEQDNGRRHSALTEHVGGL